jgi:diacylglycerol kinase (ATP)
MTTGPRDSIAVLLNSRAGKGRHSAQVAAAVATLRRTGLEVRVMHPHTVDEALRACRDAVADDPAALVVAGGDGTVHLAIQALARTGVPLGILPTGTGNDFAMEVGISADIARAAADQADALVAGRTHEVDLARLSGPSGHQSWFAAVLGAGFDAIVNERANQMRWPRGARRYDLAVLAELGRLKARRYRISLDGAPARDVDAVLVAVGNTASYGGGMRICPAAVPTDGLLDLVIGQRMSRATLLRLKPRLYPGTHVEHPLVSTYRARTVRIEGRDITCYVDGERACGLPIQITADPAALRLLG